MTKQAKLEAVARLLMEYRPGETIAEYANKIVKALEDK